MKLSISNVLGVLQIIISFIAAVFPNLFGFSWGDLEFQEALVAAGTMTGNAVAGWVNIVKLRDKGEVD